MAWHKRDVVSHVFLDDLHGGKEHPAAGNQLKVDR
jgi:hypothetical protein